MSDPSAIQIPVHQALTSDMMLGLKPSAPRSRAYRLSVAPLNASGGALVGGSQVIIELPTGRKGTWLDQSQSYLKFSVQCSSTAASNGGTGIYLDNSAYSFFQRLDIYNSSNLLETMNEYGQFCNFMLDTQLTQSDKAGLSAMIGTNYSIDIVAGASVTEYALQAMIQTPGDRSGMALASVSIAAGISTAIPYTFCLPLQSGIVGVNASKMLPIGKLHSPIRMEFTLAANDDAIYYGLGGAGAIWQLINVEFCACYVELQDDSLDMPEQQGVPEYISTSTYRQASTYLPTATSGEFTTLIPFRCASLTALYARFRNQASAVQGVNASAAYRKGSSINPNFGSYYFRIGSSIYPNKPIYLINGSVVGTGAEAYTELLKSFHALGSSQTNTSLVYNQFNVAATATQGWSLAYPPVSKGATLTADTFGNAFAIGLECQSFSNRNDTILSGISTLNSQIYFTGSIYTGLTAGGTNSFNYTADFFSTMDMILVIENGIMSAKF